MRIFIFGKVYDLDNQPIVDIEKDIAKRVTDFTTVDIGVRIYQDAGEIEVIFYRGINFNTDDDVLLEQDTWIISGEGYKSFVPAYSTSACFSHPMDACYYIDKYDFCNIYKRNAIFYGADRIKDVDVQEHPNMLILMLRY